MKKLYLVVITVGMFLSAGSLHAQTTHSVRPSQSEPGHQGRHHGNPVEWKMNFLKEKLKLNESQNDSIRNLLTADWQKQRADFQKEMQSGERPDRETMRKKMQARTKEEDAKIKTWLTADQQKVYDKIIEERAQRMKQRFENQKSAN